MKVWLPFVQSSSGSDVFTSRLADGLQSLGHEVETEPFPLRYQLTPWLLSRARAPRRLDVVVANTWNGFAFKRPQIPLVVVEHHCVFDPAFRPYRSLGQTLFHETLVRRFEKRSFQAANAVVAVSRYTASAVSAAFESVEPRVVLNGLDIQRFSPKRKLAGPGDPVRVLFVGNWTKRKGADLLPAIKRELGAGYQIAFSGGLRVSRHIPTMPGLVPLGRLSESELIDAYRHSDVLLSPSRLEGFGYSVAEAMACGLPVVATNGSSLAELVTDGTDGRLCRTDDVRDFAGAIRWCTRDRDRWLVLSRNARATAVERFGLRRFAEDYVALVAKL